MHLLITRVLIKVTVCIEIVGRDAEEIEHVVNLLACGVTALELP